MNIKIYNTPSPLTVTELYKQPAIGYPESLKTLKAAFRSVNLRKFLCQNYGGRERGIYRIPVGLSFNGLSESATSQICVAF